MKNKILLTTLLFVIGLQIVSAQQHPPFWNDIQNFKKQDAQNFPPKNAILFIGSSSFTMWKDVNDYFPEQTIINRGFGGSTLKDQIFYFNDLVPLYQPKQIVIYCGENDLSNSNTPADSAVTRFKRLYKLIRSYNKNIPLAYISIKPSPSRYEYMPKFEQANKEIKRFLRCKRKSKYIDVYNAMLNEQGKPLPNIFLKDSLHMNADGYKIWQRIIRPYLK